MTLGGSEHPLGWQPQGPSPQDQHPHQPELDEPPLAVPGWGGVLTALGAVLAVVGVFFVDVIGDFGFSDLDGAIQAEATKPASGGATWIEVYRIGALVTLLIGVVQQVMWTVRTIRASQNAYGSTRRSIREGNLGPTRNLLTFLAGAALLFQMIMVSIWIGGEHVSGLGPGPWLLMVGTALCAVGVWIGLRQPDPQD